MDLSSLGRVLGIHMVPGCGGKTVFSIIKYKWAGMVATKLQKVSFCLQKFGAENLGGNQKKKLHKIEEFFSISSSELKVAQQMLRYSE